MKNCNDRFFTFNDFLVCLSSMIIVLSIIGITTFFESIIDPIKCEAKWGARAKFEYWAGCLVETNKGYLPESAVISSDVGTDLK